MGMARLPGRAPRPAGPARGTGWGQAHRYGFPSRLRPSMIWDPAYRSSLVCDKVVLATSSER